MKCGYDLTKYRQINTGDTVPNDAIIKQKDGTYIPATTYIGKILQYHWLTILVPIERNPDFDDG